ncbi:Polyketide cyclase / dehydrase and lipid transport [Burkholderia multivorans]|uniref:SRPBCC family protein n=1 Tax=Burkholderia multivorans TaxID=87883 RepID=UPI0019C46EA4|nr:SRPBCC family protein [Burkholderia multivorans]CAB5285590.1 Polyketide cyclase / dehydrase and lipid transport [Burkholderia multivorans]CAB5302572.1 Polyketide cyclase / dehydrase and lipid transport [Burkholderia multivorans]CAB5302746.1 Polyketide cyclase / dehydrase and lipid transport [Burkholderia multivorans]CAB5303725.1 Polyketide cyclase / dehydrase and lipid transport [Burkholderia multivorans]CAB5304255.1 Polyketide cyclase / dehydrase and lipid transport [Burkholderia multivora
MTRVYYSKVIAAPADRVWPVIRDFGALPVWFPFVENCVLGDGAAADQVGAVRTNTVTGGNVIQEQLLELSDRDRRIVYSVISGDVPVIDYTATLTVHAVTEDNRSFVTWSADFDVNGEVAPVAEWVRSGIFETCLKELERVLQDPQSPVGRAKGAGHA